MTYGGPARREKAEVDVKHVEDGLTDEETPQASMKSLVAGEGGAVEESLRALLVFCYTLTSTRKTPLFKI